MASLTKDLRRLLERTVAEARKIGEEGAEQSLQHLAVDVPRPHDALNTEEKKLRVSLRAHAKQVGDRLETRPAHLIQAVAYEHWHRMLFARFLIENDLLLHPEHGVALSLDEIKELALGGNRAWVEVAADYAQRMLLSRVFQPEDPALRVSLPTEKRLQLETKVNSLPREVFLADDSLGWVYQFWQRDEKDRVNKSEVKIGADELAPVTQLFTEDYMVLFLLENTLGAWWTARHGKPELPGYNWTYLRLNEDGTLAAGTFDGWPRTARELRVLDPCMGSGHFLTFALRILARMRAAEEGLSLSDAIFAVLRDNLFGLELDPRCSQIAAFNLALTAWKLAGKHFEIPQLNLACSGLGTNAKEEDWVKLAGSDGRRKDLMRWLYSLFSNAPTLGSLIDPRRVGKPMVEEEIGDLLPLLDSALSAGQQSEEMRELAIAAHGLVEAARILADRFTLVLTNVPYLGRSKQGGVLSAYCAENHSDAKTDLATCFVDRSLRLLADGGTAALVTPQNWLFLKTYTSLRQRLFRESCWCFVAKLGPNAFQDMNWWAATTALVGISRCVPPDDQFFMGIDVGSLKEQSQKASALASLEPMTLSQKAQLSSPDSRIVLGQLDDFPLLSTYAAYGKGSTTGDSPRYHRCFWELDRLPPGAVPWLDSPCPGDLWSGRSLVLLNGLDDSDLVAEHGSRIHGQAVWGRPGVAVNKSNKLQPFLSSGEVFDDNIGTIVPLEPAHVPAIFSFCESPEYHRSLRKIDQMVKVTAATLVKVPFDLPRWQAVALERYPTGLPKPYSSDLSQWLFNGCPKDSDHPLQVAVARLVGYSWPRQTGSSFPNCSALDPDRLGAYADTDGIVCFAPHSGEESAVEKLRSLLRAAYGEEYNLEKLLKGKKSTALEEWLRDEFFDEHCRLLHQRPFVWHIWDGRKDGFHALVNYHKLDHKTLEKLIYSSLGDWISRQRQDLRSGVEGADGRLAAAEHLQNELKKILEGENPYDLFIRWKPLREQPIGWNPDLNNGVRMNIRPWITQARLYRATKPGILRITPNIKYGKDRGKEPDRDQKDFPWFKDTRDRTNDIHLSLHEKRRARGLA
jgi:hypothetical protein